MNSIESIEKKDIIELLNKNWLTHDAMWLAFSFQHAGIELTNKINKTAAKEMAKIEAKRIIKLFDLKEINSFDSLKVFIEKCSEIVQANSLGFNYSFPKQNIMLWEATSCFAHTGVKRIGFIDSYDCGVFARIEGWFEGLNISYDANPKFIGCLMHQKGTCSRTYEFKFD